MMTREELEAALKRVLPRKAAGPYPDRPAVLVGEALEVVVAAARKQLALMPALVDDPECGDCDHLPRKVYPPETVKKIKGVLRSIWPVDPTWWPSDKHAVAVLDALGETE